MTQGGLHFVNTARPCKIEILAAIAGANGVTFSVFPYGSAWLHSMDGPRQLYSCININ